MAAPPMKLVEYRALLGPVAVVALFVIGMVWSPFEPHRDPIPEAPAPPAAPLGGSAQGTWSEADWAVFAEKVGWAVEHDVASLPLGRAIADLGRTFVGTPYEPGTLEVEGPERVVINFRSLDCVTFVENVLALTRFVRDGGGALVADGRRAAAEGRYQAILAEIRYRDGTVTYPTRLHYFSDWIAHHDRGGRVRDLSGELGGEVDREPVSFMSTHPEAYRQLVDPVVLAAIGETEKNLSRHERRFVPEAAIARVAGRIQEGDVIAATSTVPGLDVAHTGLAVRVDGELRLLHAPLVGSAVQISERSLADRIAGISGQDGIMVARPLER